MLKTFLNKAMYYFLVLLVVGSLGYYKRDAVLSFAKNSYNNVTSIKRNSDFVSCVNKYETLTLLNTIQDDTAGDLYVGVTYNLPVVSNPALAKQQFSDSFNNLFNCSIKYSQSWNTFYVVYFNVVEFYGVDDGKAHYAMKGMFVAQYTKSEVISLAKDTNTGRDMMADTNYGIIIFTDVSGDNTYFHKSNPIGDPQLAIKRYINYSSQYPNQ